MSQLLRHRVVDLRDKYFGYGFIGQPGLERQYLAKDRASVKAERTRSGSADCA